GGQRTHPPLDDPVQLLGVVTACLVCGKTFVHLQLLLPHRLAETAVETVAVGCDEHLTPVRTGVDVRRCHTGKGASGTSTSDPTEFPIGDERLTERENTLVQSHVDLLTTSAVLAFPQSSKCAVDREKTRDLVTETDPGTYRGSIRIPGKCTQTTHGLGDTAKTSIGGAWPALPESGHVDHDEARIFLDHRGVVQTPRGKSARREVLEDDVGLPEDVRGQCTVLLRLEVEHDRLLVPRQRGPPQAPAVLDHATGTHGATTRGFDPDHPGAAVTQELTCERSCDEAAELHDGDPVQGSLGHRWPPKFFRGKARRSSLAATAPTFRDGVEDGAVPHGTESFDRCFVVGGVHVRITAHRHPCPAERLQHRHQGRGECVVVESDQVTGPFRALDPAEYGANTGRAVLLPSEGELRVGHRQLEQADHLGQVLAVGGPVGPDRTPDAFEGGASLALQ